MVRALAQELLERNSQLLEMKTMYEGLHRSVLELHHKLEEEQMRVRYVISGLCVVRYVISGLC